MAEDSGEYVLDEDARQERISALLDQLEEELGEDDPYIFCCPGRYRSSARTDDEALHLLKEAAALVGKEIAKEKLRALFAGLF